MEMKITILFILGVLISISVSAQWENPSERYLNSYKKFVDAKCPIAQDDMKHFVYFARDREALHNHPFLNNSRFEGAQIMYSWTRLEPSEGEYDLSAIHDDYNYLKSKGKKLFIQLQDATFNPKYKGIPDYLETEEYDGGAIYQRADNGEPEGWVAKRWNKKVQAKFAHLLAALGQVFDGKIEILGSGLVL
jgi:hypothetical protein